MNITKEERQKKFIAEHPQHYFTVEQSAQTIRKDNMRFKKILKAESRRIYLEKIVALRNSRLTLEQIANKPQYRVSRERIRQLLAEAEKLGMDVIHRARPLLKKEARTCKCGISFETYAHAARKYCSKQCLFHYNRKYANKDVRREVYRALQKHKYHSDPKFKEKMIKASTKYYHKTKANPLKKAKQKIYSERHKALHPEKLKAYRQAYWLNNREKILVCQRARYARNKIKK